MLAGERANKVASTNALVIVVFESWKLYHCVAQEPTNLKPLTRNN